MPTAGLGGLITSQPHQRGHAHGRVVCGGAPESGVDDQSHLVGILVGILVGSGTFMASVAVG
jgi:hypothetical protein